MLVLKVMDIDDDLLDHDIVILSKGALGWYATIWGFEFSIVHCYDWTNA